VSCSGPTGKILLMPEAPNSVLICVATGTGIAPFRSFWRRCFFENVPSWKFTGLLWVFMGVANSDAKLYDDEMQQITNTFPEQFRLDYALSREQQNRKGGKMYIQDKVRSRTAGAGQGGCSASHSNHRGDTVAMAGVAVDGISACC
jgi:ferredoxin--NADP+ reductase